jgi:hypothetical protein
MSMMKTIKPTKPMRLLRAVGPMKNQKFSVNLHKTSTIIGMREAKALVDGLFA